VAVALPNSRFLLAAQCTGDRRSLGYPTFCGHVAVIPDRSAHWKGSRKKHVSLIAARALRQYQVSRACQFNTLSLLAPQ